MPPWNSLKILKFKCSRDWSIPVRVACPCNQEHVNNANALQLVRGLRSSAWIPSDYTATSTGRDPTSGTVILPNMVTLREIIIFYCGILRAARRNIGKPRHDSYPSRLATARATFIGGKRFLESFKPTAGHRRRRRPTEVRDRRCRGGVKLERRRLRGARVKPAKTGLSGSWTGRTATSCCLGPRNRSLRSGNHVMCGKSLSEMSAIFRSERSPVSNGDYETKYLK